MTGAKRGAIDKRQRDESSGPQLYVHGVMMKAFALIDNTNGCC
jgi:hypothetical protein